MNLNFNLSSTVHWAQSTLQYGLETYVDPHIPLVESALRSGLGTLDSLAKEHIPSLHPYVAPITTVALSSIALLALCQAGRKASSTCLWGTVAALAGSTALTAHIIQNGYLD